MLFTLFAKSSAYSWRMSFSVQVLCRRMVIEPWALTIAGRPRPAAAPAPARNLRREARAFACRIRICLPLCCPLVAGVPHHVRQRAARGVAAAQPCRVGLSGTHARGELLEHRAAAQPGGIRRDPRQRLENILADGCLAADVRIDQGSPKAVAAGLEAVVA